MSTRVSIVLFGETGTGKSTLGNTFLGCKSSAKDEELIFSESEGINAHTYETKAHDGKFFDKLVRITDTPGTGESGEADKKHLADMARVVTADDTVRVFVIVMNYQCPRFEQREKKLFDHVISMFPNAPWFEHIAVVWTRYYSSLPQKMNSKINLFSFMDPPSQKTS